MKKNKIWTPLLAVSMAMLASKAAAKSPSDSWVRFPEITGFQVSNEEPVRITTQNDHCLVAIFIASYDIGSQNEIQHFQSLQRRFQQKYTDFVYVFVNDLNVEAINFMREHGIDGLGIMADDLTKKAFQFPPLNLPMIYVSDRKGWLAMRFAEADKVKIQAVERYLEAMTAL